MNIKVQCGCGTRYSFEVEPREGRMPFPVQCPACHADGTEAANQIIAATPAPRLSIEPAPSADAVPPPHAAPMLDLAAFKAQKRRAEKRAYRKGAGLMAGVVILFAAALGAWAWYSFVGSKPHLAATLKLAGDAPAQIQFLGPDKILIATASEASLRDPSLKKVLWSAHLSDAPSPWARRRSSRTTAKSGFAWETR